MRRGAYYHVVSGHLYLAANNRTSRPRTRSAWTRDRNRAARFRLPEGEAHARRFWGGDVVPA